jgi:hypothetical protein
MDGHDSSEALQQPASNDSDSGASEVVSPSDKSEMGPEEKIIHRESNAPQSQIVHPVPTLREILARNSNTFWVVWLVTTIVLSFIIGVLVHLAVLETKHSTGYSRYLPFSIFGAEGRVRQRVRLQATQH